MRVLYGRGQTPIGACRVSNQRDGVTQRRGQELPVRGERSRRARPARTAFDGRCQRLARSATLTTDPSSSFTCSSPARLSRLDAILLCLGRHHSAAPVCPLDDERKRNWSGESRDGRPRAPARSARGRKTENTVKTSKIKFGRGAQMHGPAHQLKVRSVHWMM